MLFQALCIVSKPLVNSNWSYSPETQNLGQNRRFFCPVWPWNLTNDLENQWVTSPKQHQALCIISSSYVNSTCSYGPETAKMGFDLCDLDLWPLTLTFCMDITSLIGNNSWKFHDDTMMGTQLKRCDRQTERQTDGRTDRGMDWTIHRAAWSQPKISLNCMLLNTMIFVVNIVSADGPALLSDLAHWGQDKMATILQTTLSNAFSWRRIWIKISLKFVPKGPIDNIPALFQIMAWCQEGDKPLSEPMMVRLTMLMRHLASVS